MNKYYTPKIEEFFVGFEYEMIPSSGLVIWDMSKPDDQYNTTWAKEFQKGIYGLESVNLLEDDLNTIQHAIEKDRIRIKYLDKKDLQELGFEILKEPYRWQFGLGLRYKLITAIYTEKDETFDPLSHISIYDNKDDQCLFFGYIQNKFELKKLMNMLKM